MMTKKAQEKSLPKYVQLANVIREEILAGKLKAGERLSTQRDLALKYSTAKMTVTQAMNRLSEEGLIRRIQGSGTYVQDIRQLCVAMVSDIRIFDAGGTRYLSTLLKELQNFFTSRQWCTRYYVNISCRESETRFLEGLKERLFDAVVLDSRWVAQNRRGELDKAAVKCVGVYPYQGLSYWVGFDDFELGRQGVASLAGLGCSNIALIGGEPEWPELGTVESGYTRGLLEAGLVRTENLVRIVKDENGAYKAYVSLRKAKPDLDGIVVSNEACTPGVLRAMLEEDGDSRDRIIIASQVTEGVKNPYVLPVVQLISPVRRQAELLGNMLIDLVEGKDVQPPHVLLSPDVYNPFESRAAKG